MRDTSYPEVHRNDDLPRRQPRRLPSVLLPEPPVPDAHGFARDVLRERALLAMTDPIGETEAIAPMDDVRARRILLETVEPPRPVIEGRDDHALLERLGGDVTRSSGRVRCPAHGGRDRNLSWRWGDRGRLLLTCFSHGCTFDDIVRAAA